MTGAKVKMEMEVRFEIEDETLRNYYSGDLEDAIYDIVPYELEDGGCVFIQEVNVIEYEELD